jgi:hypothetical protein
MAVSLTMVRTLVGQILSMFPMPYVSDSELSAMSWPEGPITWALRELDEPVSPEAYAAARAAVAADRRILAVRYALNAVHARQTVEWVRLRRIDADNGLYAYLEALEQLRAGGEERDNAAMQLLRAAEAGPSARLYAARQREVAIAGFARAGVSPRRAAVEADRLGMVFRELHEAHRPVLRELTNRLVQRAAAWAEAGRAADAAVAQRAVLHLFDGVIADDATQVDVATLAAECELKALRAPLPLAGDSKEAGELAAARSQKAREVAGFVERWRSLADPNAINVLPWTGEIVVARSAHERVLRSLASAAACVGTWLVLLVASLVLGAAAAWGTLRQRAGDHGTAFAVSPVWASRSVLSGWLPAGFVLMPLIAILLMFAFGHVPLVWLLSAPTLPAMLFSPWVTVVFLGAAARLWVRLCPAGPTHGDHEFDAEAARVPLKAVKVAVGAIAVGVVLALLLIPMKSEAWRPPATVQYLRKVGALFGLVCFMLTVGWIAWGQVRRWRRGLRAGALARATLPVAARALLGAAVLSTIALGWNQWNDSRHQRAFVAAAADPISDRLGPGAAKVLRCDELTIPGGIASASRPAL